MHRDGYEYLRYVNKFIRGEDVSQRVSYCDLETKKALYEVKGVRIFHISNKQAAGLGRYQIHEGYHKQLKKEADKKGKTALYLFVVKLGGRKMFRGMKWETVDYALRTVSKHFKRKDGAKIHCLSVKEVW
ncbi:hypothetical protein CMI37_39370 [Candidatus Pacearchaeota archaeon]|nr:hypothetical protein [Candidatus Pacearchaeota archaeon]|tara:strand:+ start:221 stop:610 length:390 start_codon:yes stop_codon:yes gene_type:complete